MKKIAKVFALFIAVLGLVGLVACDKKPPVNEPVQPYNALGNFVDGGDAIYTINNSESELTFSYEKSNDAHVYSYIYADVTAALDAYKTLVITTHGSGTMLVKLEGSAGVKEVQLNVVSTQATYDWNLMNDAEFLKGVNKVVIIAAPGKSTANGNVTISKLTFVEEIAGSTGGYIIPTGFNNIPQNINEYNGKDEKFDINAKWQNTNDEVYTIEQNAETKEVSVKYKKEAGMEWSCMESNVKGDFSKFKSIVIVLKGEEGKKVLVKAEGTGVAEQSEYTLDGTKQVLTINISALNSTAKNAIAKVVIFGSPNAIQDGQFTIYEAYMTEETLVEAEYNGNGNFEITKGVNGMDVAYNTDGGWQWFTITPNKVLKNVEVLNITISGNVNVLVKPNDNSALEKRLDLNGRTLISLPINTNVDRILIFVSPEAVAKGTLTVESIFVKTSEPTSNVYESGDSFDVNHFWKSGDQGEYTFTDEETKTVVDYHTTGAWKFFSNPIEGVTTEFNYLKVRVVSDKDVLLTLKPADNNDYQKHINLVANEEYVDYLPIPANITKIVGFIGGDQEAGANGKVEFLEMRLVNVADSSKEFASLLKPYYTNDYTVTTTEGVTTVNYSKSDSYTAAYVRLIPVYSYNHEVVIKVKGTEGQGLLIKFNDNSAYENPHTFTGGEDTIVITKVPALIESIFIMAAPGNNSAKGSYEISMVVNEKAVDNTPATYTFDNATEYTVTGDVTSCPVTIKYAKTSEWGTLSLNGSKTVYATKLRIVVSAETAQNLIIKFNGNNATEKNLELTSEGTVFEWTFDYPTDINSVQFIAAPQNASATGTVTIVSFEVVLAE